MKMMKLQDKHHMFQSMDDMYDVVVVGGGIVGLAVAYVLLERHPDLKIAMFEKEEALACHQTGHNSGVVHSGIYYRPGSLKASLSKRGRELLIDFAKRHRLPFEQTGKLIAAVDDHERERLIALWERGKHHGLNIQKVTSDEARSLEPAVYVKAGIWVPETGIIDYPAVARTLGEIIVKKGGNIHLGTRVQRIIPCLSAHDPIRLEVIRKRKGPASSEVETIKTYALVAAAGLWSDRLARASGLSPEIQIVPFRGMYARLRLEREKLVRGLIYPVPNPALPFLGVHFTRMIHGGVHVGPNAMFALKREGYRKGSIDLRDLWEMLRFSGTYRLALRYRGEGMRELMRAFWPSAFLRSARRLLPDLTKDDLLPEASGIRAQAVSRQGELLDDFYIVRSERMVHILNAPSPAATAALAIAEYVVEKEFPWF
ncbi:MAG: L-2-hydroxyglutarate oxidase [Candidatus Carbobacillus sp.]|nr:L-2-hydroxyglutarate oxidase [Candidatus Carbobacillus sp.]